MRQFITDSGRVTISTIAEAVAFDLDDVRAAELSMQQLKVVLHSGNTLCLSLKYEGAEHVAGTLLPVWVALGFQRTELMDLHCGPHTDVAPILEAHTNVEEN